MSSFPPQDPQTPFSSSGTWDLPKNLLSHQCVTNRITFCALWNLFFFLLLCFLLLSMALLNLQSSRLKNLKVNINALSSPTSKIYDIYTYFLNCYHRYHYSLASHFFQQLWWQIKCSSFGSSILSEVFLCIEIFSVSPLLVGLSQKAIARIYGPA